MIRLETTDGVVLTRIMKEISPISYSSNKQVNRLLDGTYHVQVIGKPLKRIEGIIISSHVQAEKINEYIDQGTLLYFMFLDKKYLVYIEEPINWTIINFAHGNKNKSYFEGHTLMIIKEELLP